jgi:V/A-type H+/Na+-transporting ATPase subunit B
MEYTRVAEIKGPLIIIDGVTKVSFDELVEIETSDGEKRIGRVLASQLAVQKQNS